MRYLILEENELKVRFRGEDTTSLFLRKIKVKDSEEPGYYLNLKDLNKDIDGVYSCYILTSEENPVFKEIKLFIPATIKELLKNYKKQKIYNIFISNKLNEEKPHLLIPLPASVSEKLKNIKKITFIEELNPSTIELEFGDIKVDF